MATVTTTLQWKGIKVNLLPGQTATDRPDLAARIFKGKLAIILKEIRESQIFGRVVAKLSIFQFQKHGLPHADILISFAADHMQSWA